MFITNEKLKGMHQPFSYNHTRNVEQCFEQSSVEYQNFIANTIKELMLAKEYTKKYMCIKCIQRAFRGKNVVYILRSEV